VQLALCQSHGAKITAVGFILFILFGNFLLVYQITASTPVLVAVGGVVLGIRACFLPRVKPSEAEIQT
jgi:hypothetical protein